jgi:hypothetical protein
MRHNPLWNATDINRSTQVIGYRNSNGRGRLEGEIQAQRKASYSQDADDSDNEKPFPFHLELLLINKNPSQARGNKKSHPSPRKQCKQSGAVFWLLRL